MKKTRIKLTHHQLVALTTFLENCLALDAPESRYDTIINILVMRFYKRLKEKTILLEPKTYSMDVDQETALAFCEFFEGTALKTTAQEGITVLRLISQFDKNTSYAGVY